MTNITGQKLAFGPDRGRQQVDVFTKDVVERVRTMSASRPFALFVIAAAIVVGLYYFVIAAPLYVSQTTVAIRGREAPAAGAASLLGALTGGGDSGASDVAELQNYVTSYDMAEKLDRRFHLREVYSKPRLDFLNWLPPNASREHFLKFFRKMVLIRTDHDSGLITVEAKAFDPVMARQIDEAILQIAADYINNISDVVRQDTLRTSERDLRQAEDDVRKARLDMTNYRASTGTIDPTAAATGTTTGIAAMQQEILEARVTRNQLLTVNRPDAPDVKQVEARIAGLEAQIAAEQKSIANLKSADSITQRLREYEGLLVASEYAERKLVAALQAYDAAKGLADQRQRFIVAVVPPNLPQDATEPHRVVSFLETMLVLVAVYGIVALAIAGIRDHQGI